MLQLRVDFMSFVVGSMRMALVVLLMNGSCAFLPPSWLILLGRLPSRFTCRLCDRSILNMGFLTPSLTAFVFKEWCMVLRVAKALLRLCGCSLLTQLCW